MFPTEKEFLDAVRSVYFSGCYFLSCLVINMLVFVSSLRENLIVCFSKQ